MARPSMAGVRITEILDAFEVCILTHGIGATSLEMIAEQAQMKRSILRHYIGNRDKIIAQFGERWFTRADQQWQQTLQCLPQKKRLTMLVNELFSEPDSEDNNEGKSTYADNVRIKESLIVEAKRSASLKTALQQSINHAIELLTTEIRLEYPKLDVNKTAAMAHGLYGIYMMRESLVALGIHQDIAKLKHAAQLLLNLKTPYFFTQPERPWRTQSASTPI